MTTPAKGQFTSLNNRVRSLAAKHKSIQTAAKNHAQAHNEAREAKRQKMAAEQRMTNDAKKGAT